MAILDEQNRQRLFDYVYRCLDEDNAADLETFAQHFLNNGEAWDIIAEHFPTASASMVRTVMMEAFAAWQKGQPAAQD
jgi:hypothetical protein